MTQVKSRYSHATKRPRLWLVVLIVLLHALALYGLARALVPDFTASMEQSVVSAFTVTITAPPDPPPPENEPEPDQGAQGEAGEQAVPKPVTAPKPAITPSPTPLPQASSTGSANRSGAQETGEGTGAAGEGLGTGSGNQGGGQGGVAVSKPVHISGSIENARDYPVPAGGREVRQGTEVIVRVIVGVDGRASQCSIYRASPDAQADRITCQLVEDRLRFRPAQDANGNAVPAPFYWRQRWF